jgi:aldose 1-epimerase
MITQQLFGSIDGREIHLFSIKNNQNDTLSITNYGGIITSWTAKDKHGKHENITIGFNALEKYLPNEPDFGALIGRYANRIGKGQFIIDETNYQLGLNEGRNQLHGGAHNFTKVIWNATVEGDILFLEHESPDGNEGFPGNLKVKVSFHLSDENELTITYQAKTDKATYINLTSHPYFNLTGNFSKEILNHELTIHALAYTPVDSEGIPTGLIAPATGTAYDFTTQKAIGLHIKEVDGYDNNFVLSNESKTVSHAAHLFEPISGRTLDVYTDQPGLQLYTSNGLDGTIIADDGTPLKKYAAVCLETQHFPDSPNQPLFPSTFLEAGQTFETVTKYKFGVQ